MAHPPTLPYRQLFEMKIESLAKNTSMLRDPLED
jgi:hypothetical protein